MVTSNAATPVRDSLRVDSLWMADKKRGDVDGSVHEGQLDQNKRLVPSSRGWGA